MRFAILLLCIVLGLFAFVDATAIDRRDELEKKCESNTDSPTHVHTDHHSQSTSKGAAANVDKAVATSKDQTKTTATAAKAKGKTDTTNTAAVDKGKNKNTDNSTTTTDTAAAATTTTDAAAAATDTATATTDNNSGGSNTCLAASALQTGSENSGQSGNITAGQVASQTSDNNFINICEGQTLTNGLQIINGSCNGIPLGFIPAKTNMPSSLILFPQHNQDIAANQSFEIQVTTTGMDLGHFTNAEETYYSAPTLLNGEGTIIGHTHVTVQDLGGSFFPTAPLNAAVFAFFQGINTAPNADNVVVANVTKGLPPGFYRVCTMVANSNHSPLQMPVAQRGAQDDCHYFSVGQSTSDSATTTNDAASSSASSSSAAAATTSAAAKKGGKKGGKSRRRRSRM